MLKVKVNVSNLTVGLLLALSGSLAFACGGSKAPAESPTESGEESPADEGDDASKKFDDMSAPEKMEHMKKVVAPTMAKVFQEYDAEHYKDFSCATCHGPGAKQGNFEMPTKDLPALDQEEMDEHPEVTKFMMERVVPEMAKLMGEEPYNPETHEGFGCFACHTKKE